MKNERAIEQMKDSGKWYIVVDYHSTTENVYSHPNVDAQKEALKGLF